MAFGQVSPAFRYAIRPVGPVRPEHCRAMAACRRDDHAIDLSTSRTIPSPPACNPHLPPHLMSLTPSELWDRLRNRARQVLPEQTYRTWLEPTEALFVEGDTLIIGAPDQFSADWNESKHADMLTSFAPVAFGHPLTVRFKVTQERLARAQMDMFVQPPPAPIVAAPIRQQQRLSTPLNPRYTFDQFVVGKSNEVAAAAAQAAAAAPGKVYNPLFIYGDTGLGKTHLMQGIAHELLRRTPSLRLAYVGTEQFTNEFVSAIQAAIFAAAFAKSTCCWSTTSNS